MSNSREKMYFENMRQNTFKTKGLTLIGFSGLVLSFGLLCFGLAGCSSSETNTAGGGPSGTEAGNAIVATIYNEDGSPAKLAKVTLIESRSLDGEEKGYTTTADTNGFIIIDSVAEGDYIMEATYEGNVIQIDVSVINQDSIKLGEQTLQKPVYINGTLSDYGCKYCDSANGTLKFYGLSHTTSVQNGAFSIGGLPSGKLNFVFIPQNGTINDAINFPTVRANAGDSIVTKVDSPKDTVKEEPKDTIKIVKPIVVDTNGPIETVILDDFKDGNNKHIFATDSTFESGCMWYMNTFGNIFITPQLTVENYYNPFLAVIEETEDGHQVHFSLDFPDSTETYGYAYWMKTKSWANITVQIGKSYVPYSIAGIDTIAFEMWGKGETIFQVVDETRKSDEVIVASKRFTLPEEKTRIAIALADIYPEDVVKTASALTWAFDANVEVYISRVELVGRNITSFWEKE